MLDQEQRRDVCYHAKVTARTLQKIYSGKPVFHGAYLRVITACFKLRIETLPPAWVPAVVGKAAAKLKAESNA